MTLMFLVAVLVIALVAVAIMAVAYGNRDVSQDAPVNANESFNQEQSRVREENLARSLALAREKGEVTNNDVERLLGVSNATAERYLDELESRGHLVQIGKTGKGVRYKVK